MQGWVQASDRTKYVLAIAFNRCLALLDGDLGHFVAQLEREFGFTLLLGYHGIKWVHASMVAAAIIIEHGLVDLSQAIENRHG